jgi:hypothetical protein
MASNNANAAFGRDGLFDLKGHVALVSGEQLKPTAIFQVS